MTMLIHPMAETQSGGKWADEEIVMLRSCVHQFAGNLNKLSQQIKSRTGCQIRTTLRKKALEDAGIPASSDEPRVKQPATKVTLNMLSATGNEVDIEAYTGYVKLEFGGSTEPHDTNNYPCAPFIWMNSHDGLFLSSIFWSVFK